MACENKCVTLHYQLKTDNHLIYLENEKKYRSR